jgi:hypothetical protein
VGPKVQEAVSDGFSATGSESDPDRNGQSVAPETPRREETTPAASKKLHNRESYGKSQRDGIDALVERSR